MAMLISFSISGFTAARLTIAVAPAEYPRKATLSFCEIYLMYFINVGISISAISSIVKSQYSSLLGSKVKCSRLM